MYPIKANKLTCTSKFGPRTYKYKGKKVSDNHKGIDLVAKPKNSKAEILVFEDGTVTSVRKTGKQYGDGCYVRIKHSNGYYTLYYHLKSGSIVVNKGDKVKKGQKIGVIGTTGQSTGIHLHFQIDKGSSASAINPYNYVFKDKELVKKTVKYYPKYTGKSNSFVDALKSLKIDSSFSNRKKIAKVNGMTLTLLNSGIVNTKMFNLLKRGKLIKP